MRHQILWLFLVLFLTGQICQISTLKVSNKKIRKFIRTLLSCKSIPGASVTIVKNGKVRMAEGFGFKDSETNETADKNTLFAMASLTKAFTAMALVKTIAERNDVKLNTPVKDIINITFFTEQITNYATLEDLLVHRVGIRDHRFIRLNTNYTRETLSRFLKHFIPSKDFRTGYVYNNQLYGLIAHIIEVLRNVSWEDTVRELLLQPIGMKDTKFITADNLTNMNLAKPHFDHRRISMDFVQKWAQIGGSSSIFSNAIDMAKWLKFLLNKGRVNGTAILDIQHFKNVFVSRNYITKPSWKYRRPKIPVTLSFSQYALAWKKGFYRGYPIITHTGTTYGYSSMITLFPDKKLGIFLALNSEDTAHTQRFLLQTYLADTYLKEKPWINKKTVCNFPKPPSKNSLRKKQNIQTLPCGPLQMYEGTYVHQLFGNVKVTYNRERNDLQLNYGFSNFRLILNKTSSLTFYGEGIDDVWFMPLGMVKFIPHSSRKNEIIAIKIPKFRRRLPPIFQKLDANIKLDDIPYSKQTNQTCSWIM